MITRRFVRRLALSGGCVLAFLATPASAGIITGSITLPPETGAYIGTSEFHAIFNLIDLGLGTLAIVNPVHSGLTGVVRTPLSGTPGVPGFKERETFTSRASFDVLKDGVFIGHFTDGTVAATTEVELLGVSGGSQLYDTELVQLDINGVVAGMPIVIREDPARASTGETRITDLGGGLFQIDSFFDVFTELSVDGGTTFRPQLDGPGRVVLVPGPASLALIATAGLVALARRRQR